MRPWRRHGGCRITGTASLRCRCGWSWRSVQASSAEAAATASSYSGRQPLRPSAKAAAKGFAARVGPSSSSSSSSSSSGDISSSSRRLVSACVLSARFVNCAAAHRFAHCRQHEYRCRECRCTIASIVLVSSESYNTERGSHAVVRHIVAMQCSSIVDITGGWSSCGCDCLPGAAVGRAGVEPCTGLRRIL